MGDKDVKAKRNAPCECGSGKKRRHCHGVHGQHPDRDSIMTRPAARYGRNDVCDCGCGKKRKKCPARVGSVAPPMAPITLSPPSMVEVFGQDVEEILKFSGSPLVEAPPGCNGKEWGEAERVVILDYYKRYKVDLFASHRGKMWQFALTKKLFDDDMNVNDSVLMDVVQGFVAICHGGTFDKWHHLFECGVYLDDLISHRINQTTSSSSKIDAAAQRAHLCSRKIMADLLPLILNGMIKEQGTADA